MACCFPCLRSVNSQSTNSCCVIDPIYKLAYLVKETALVILLGLVIGAVPALAPAGAVGYVALLVTSSPEIAKIAGFAVWAGGIALAGWLARNSLKDLI